MAIKRGDIYYIARSYAEEGSEQYAGRPAIVVSNDMNNANSTTVEVVYLTTQPKTEIPTHCVITSSTKLSTALCEQISTVHMDRLETCIGHATQAEMQDIDKCMMISLGIKAEQNDRVVPDDYKALKIERDLLERQYNQLLAAVFQQGK